MDNIEEKISALYDGELSEQEIDEVLIMVEKDSNLREKISKYGLLTSAVKHENNNIQSIVAKRKKPNFNFWLSNSITAAAAVMITFFSLNQFDLNRMGEDISAKNQINTAINSKEANPLQMYMAPFSSDPLSHTGSHICLWARPYRDPKHCCYWLGSSVF